MLLPIYQRAPITIDHGDGPYLYDTTGRRYLDFITGVGVNALGHNHPRITKVIAEQAARCIHTSNLYHHAYLKPLAERLAKWSGLDQVFFTNSGSEAMETALKAAKAYGTRRALGKFRIVALNGGFHGRTMGSLSVTGSFKYRQPFHPLLPGITFVTRNSIDELRAAVTDETAAIVVEPVQGEGGIYPLQADFLQEIQRLAVHHDALWIADETQCGLGRTGSYFAFQRIPNIQPDIVVTAKPLAAGLPLGATMFNEKAASAFGPGTHGSTFGGGPLACRVALEVLDIIEELLPRIRTNGTYLRERLHELPAQEIRTAGMMAGIEMSTPAASLVDEALQQGLLINCTHETTLRLLPPYIATQEHIDEAMATLQTLCTQNTLTAA